MARCYRSICSDRKTTPDSILHNQLPLSAITSSGLMENFLSRFEARLNSSWQTALLIKWYAVLINMCLAIHEMTKHKRVEVNTNNTGSMNRKLHILTELLVGLSNVLAIVGLLLPNGSYLLPYLFIHLIILVLELHYFVIRTMLSWASQKPMTNVGRSAKRSASTLLFIVFNLLIMTGARFAINVGRFGATAT
ncbi:uncharacterized protein LOC129723322 isoform X2 [Wyeomyia smithii]|uniref:uncharacterized protein LOC129723322 isoform X2 n=1 Tax=Wyeomyia smithii TaxID=174621 RepID=UPI002467F4A3|nr:uncharacterized protein LOC129723322 isoform X2 [Wyeomyia smithii]